jgi:hypothetical protein
MDRSKIPSLAKLVGARMRDTLVNTGTRYVFALDPATINCGYVLLDLVEMRVARWGCVPFGERPKDHHRAMEALCAECRIADKWNQVQALVEIPYHTNKKANEVRIGILWCAFLWP